MQRIFHPIGQGAFFSEHFEEANGGFAIVYDCGSSSLKERARQTKVNSSFKAGEVIDILYISHFHADHINGIGFLKKQCAIKNVVIPYLDDTAKALVKIVNFLDFGFTETEIIDDPEGYFGNDTRIIRVNPMPEKSLAETNTEGGLILDEDSNITSIPAGVEVDENQRSLRIESGFPIRSGKIKYWLFVPFNFQMNERLRLFLEAIDAKGLQVKSLQRIEDIEKNKQILKEAYLHATGDLNKNSLFLYSGPTQALQSGTIFHWNHNYFWRFLIHPDTDHAGCLYTGDADLNEEHLVDQLTTTLSRYRDLVGTLVVSHHGALKNHRLKLYQAFPNRRFNIFSYGVSNTYGHPSDIVVADLIAPGNAIVRVTEEDDTIAIMKTVIR